MIAAGAASGAIVVYTDLEPESAEGLQAAARFARDAGAVLHVIHAMDVVGKPLREMVGPLQQGIIQKRRAALIAQVAEALDAEGVPWSAWIDGRDPARSAADLVRESHASLVIVAGADHSAGSGIWRRVARAAGVPVLVIRDRDRTEIYRPADRAPGGPTTARLTRAKNIRGRCNTDMVQELMARVTREVERLLHELTVQIPAALRENPEPAEYEAIVARQRTIHRRIRHLQKAAAELPRVSPDAVFLDRIGFGSRVRVEDLGSGEPLTYTVMSGDDIDLDAGEISLESPVGWALLGAREGDEVVVATPRGDRRLRVGIVETLYDGHDSRIGRSPEGDAPVEFVGATG